MVSNMARTGPEQTGNGPQVSPSAADFQPNSPTQAPSQAQILRNPHAVAAALKHLTAEGASEAAHIASVYARHFVEDMEIGDVWAAEHDMRGAVMHLKEAAAKFREWQGKPLANKEPPP
jgi:hypothetical protein